MDLSRLNTFLLVETPESIRASLIPGVSSIDLSDTYLHIPIHPNSRKYLSHGATGLYNDCKRSEVDGPDKGNQTSPVPGQLAYQDRVSGRNTSEHLRQWST